MNGTIKTPLSLMDTAMSSTRPKPRKPVIICKEPKRAIEIMNKKGRFPLKDTGPSIKKTVTHWVKCEKCLKEYNCNSSGISSSREIHLNLFCET